MTFRRAMLAAVAGFLALASAPAYSADLAFTAALRGDKDPTITGSKATGEAKIVVHTDEQTVDVAMKVTGITLAQFFQNLAHAPVGPVHLHIYAADGSSSLLLPFPMGNAYGETPSGFVLTETSYPYAEGAKILNSAISFEGFVDALTSGAVVMNIHTEAFHDGEISGRVQSAP